MNIGQNALWGLAAIMLIALVVWLAARVRTVNRKRKQAHQARARANAPRDPFGSEFMRGGDLTSLGLGSLVEWMPGKTYTVRGVVRLQQGRYVWHEYFIDPINGAKCYLSVSVEDGDTKLVVWHAVDNFDSTPSQRQIEFDGVLYIRNESGTAGYSTSGTTDLPEGGTVRYHDYTSSDDKRLSFEQFDDGEWELSIGTVVPRSMLTIYPASS